MWVVLLVTVVLTSAAVGVSLGQTPEYEASIKILVGQKQGSYVPGSLGSDVQGLQQLAQTMADLISTRPNALHKKRSRRSQALIAGSAAAATAYLISSSVDWNWYIPASTLPFFALAAVATGMTRRQRKQRPTTTP